MDERAALRGLDVDAQAALVAIEGAEESGREAPQSAGSIPLRSGLDFDNVGTEISENEPRRRSHNRVTELENANPGQRKRGRSGHVRSFLAAASRG